MAIKQERLIALLEFSQDLLDRVKYIKEFVDNLRPEIRHAYSLKDLELHHGQFNTLLTILSEKLILEPEILEKFLTEKAHFALVAKRNIKNREAVAALRQRRKGTNLDLEEMQFFNNLQFVSEDEEGEEQEQEEETTEEDGQTSVPSAPVLSIGEEIKLIREKKDRERREAYDARDLQILPPTTVNPSIDDLKTQYPNPQIYSAYKTLREAGVKRKVDICKTIADEFEIHPLRVETIVGIFEEEKGPNP